MRRLIALVLTSVVAPAMGNDQLVDDFSSGELFLPLPAGVTFEGITQTADLGPIVLGPRRWGRVWSGIQNDEQSATISIDTDDGVFRVDTPGDPFTYYTLSYELFGGFEFFQPIPFDANEAGLDRVRLRFGGDSVRIFHTVRLMSEIDDQAQSTSRSLGGRFNLIPGGVVEIPFEDFSSDPAFFDGLIGLDLESFRYQGEFELDSIELAGPSFEADLNRDGVVDEADLAYLQSSFMTGKQPSSALSYHTADMNRDGFIDGADYTLWRDASETLEATSAPEPTGLVVALTITALAPSLSRRRRETTRPLAGS